jgi:hypothetical protein
MVCSCQLTVQFVQAVGKQLFGGVARTQACWDNWRIVWHGNHCGVLAAEESSDEFEARWIHKKHAVASRYGPHSSQCPARGQCSIAELCKRESGSFPDIHIEPGEEAPVAVSTAVALEPCNNRGLYPSFHARRIGLRHGDGRRQASIWYDAVGQAGRRSQDSGKRKNGRCC